MPKQRNSRRHNFKQNTQEPPTFNRQDPNKSERETSLETSDDSDFYGEEASRQLNNKSSISETSSSPDNLNQTLTLVKGQQNIQSTKNTIKCSVLCISLSIVCVFIFSMAIYYGVFNFQSTVKKHKLRSQPSTDLPTQIANLLEEMSNSFPAQSGKTWISFLSALTSIVEEEPTQPAVLLLVGERDGNSLQTLQCIAMKLALLTNGLFSTNVYLEKSVIDLNGVDLIRKQEESFKEELDSRIRSVLNHSYSVVLGPLQELPPRAALLLHGYCDNFVAPYKKRVIILTVTFDSNDRPMDSKQVDRKLRGFWDSNLGPDKSASLVSRIANNPVFIKSEPGSIPCANHFVRSEM